jgi:Family of unknown function (DUF6515)
MKIRYSKVFHMLLAFCIALVAMTTEGMAQKKGGAQRPSNVQKPASRPAAKPAAKSSNVQKPAARPSTTSNQSAKSKVGDKRDGDGRGGGANNGKFNNNNVNIDKSRGDVNVNIDNSKDIKVRNSRNTVVRHNTYRPYSRPPYVYGGYRYRCYHPYYYHPYRPFVWGPVWHPWGFFIATLTATAIIVSFADADLPPVFEINDILARMDQDMLTNNHYRLAGPNIGSVDPPDAVSTQAFVPVLADGEYYYDQGVFYLKEKGGYTVVAAPVGALIKTLPSGYETVVVDETSGVKNYYWGGTFYEKVSNGYKVVPPTSGTIVEHISDGGEEVKLGDITYVKLGETYYQPVQLNGKNVYEVVDVEEDK